MPSLRMGACAPQGCTYTKDKPAASRWRRCGVDIRRLQRTTDQVRDALGLTTQLAASSLFSDRFLLVNRTI